MAFTKQYYFPTNRLEAFQFDRALAFTRTRSNTQAIARAYLVEHKALDVITGDFSVTRQNVFRAVHTILHDAQVALTTIESLKSIYKKLKIKQAVHVLAHPFFFTDNTLDELGKTLKSTPAAILVAAKCVLRKYRHFATRDAIKEREAEFKKYLPFARVREKSIEIAYDHLVLDESLTEVAKKHGITTQNAYNIIQRFKDAEKRYEEQQDAPKPQKRVVKKVTKSKP